MEKKRYRFGICILVGLIFGSLFANFVYQSQLVYSNQINQFVLKMRDVKPSWQLWLYLMLKRGKQYAIFYLLAYILQPNILLILSMFFFSFLMGSVLSLQVAVSGFLGIFQVLVHLFPHFICYGICLFLLFRRNQRMEGEGKGSLLLEFVFLFAGIMLECFVNPMMI